jgi:hypothetical protein
VKTVEIALRNLLMQKNLSREQGWRRAPESIWFGLGILSPAPGAVELALGAAANI